MLSHDCRVKRTSLVRIVDLLCGALLIGITLWVACRYGALPDRIPIHYGADGVADGYGAKSMIWVTVAIAWILVGIMSALEQFPKFWNVPVKVTKEKPVSGTDLDVAVGKYFQADCLGNSCLSDNHVCAW